MTYRVRHETTYDYADPVSVSHHILRLTPRNFGRQRCQWAEISILPKPASRVGHIDYFGNAVTSFTLLEPHERLVVEATSELQVYLPPPLDFYASPSWEAVRDNIASDHSDEGLEAYQFVFDSKRVEAKPELADYAAESFRPGRPLLDAVFDLTHRINQISASIPKPPKSARRSKRSLKSAAASARIFRTCRSPACVRSACPPGMSAVTCVPCRLPAARVWWAPTLLIMVFRVEPRHRLGGFRSHQ